ncbi:MAG: Gfo/Idh/MocA family oxidoreductase [Armatimonadetes bacterium]|nr:Gfo/Idh/MocA family oxidoreductase [Armatimonadota bacterium]
MSKVKAAILGCGGMAGYHASRLKVNPDVEIVGLSDVGESQVQTFIDRNLKDYKPVPPIFTDPARLYAETQPDAVAIATPHTLHYEHGKQALEAGCHVMMEKPMVTNSDHAHELAALVKKLGKVFTIGYNTPCSPEFRYLRQLVRSKELGRLELVSGWLVQDWKKPTTGLWRQVPDLSGGGQMYDSGAHLFNSLVWTVEQPISEVHAFVDNQEAPVDINGTVNIRFADGTLATIMIGGNCSSSGAGLYFAFENGRVDVDGWGGSWIRIFRREGGEEKYPQITGSPQAPIDNFINAILGRDEPMTSPINGVLQSELMDAIYESAKTGQVARPKAR